MTALAWFVQSSLCGAPPYSSVAQWQSIRLLTGGLLVRVQPEEPLFSISYERSIVGVGPSVGDFVGSGPQKPLVGQWIVSRYR